MIRTLLGDITKIEYVDAVVNAANSSLLGGGGVDGAIHRAAGKQLLLECMQLHGCKTGQAKLTKGYNMNCKYIIHTVGPVWNKGKKQEAEKLKSCYKSFMELALENEIRTIAFPSVSTGIYHFPVELAAELAVSTVSEFLKAHEAAFDYVEWVLFDAQTKLAYDREVEKLKMKTESVMDE